MEPNNPKKIQFAVPPHQKQLDPQAAEQVSRTGCLGDCKITGKLVYPRGKLVFAVVILVCPRATHVVLGGTLVPAGTMLVTSALDKKMPLSISHNSAIPNWIIIMLTYSVLAQEFTREHWKTPPCV
uniref:Uncharacterized protein n=1 Tax=Paramormyrops kingsleyae TaxID=1676925 RepID=A0A3B3TE17_9TELE